MRTSIHRRYVLNKNYQLILPTFRTRPAIPPAALSTRWKAQYFRTAAKIDNGGGNAAETNWWQDYRETLTAPDDLPDTIFSFAKHIVKKSLGEEGKGHGYFQGINAVKSTLAFVKVSGGPGLPTFQLTLHNPDLIKRATSIKNNTPVQFLGTAQMKPQPKNKPWSGKEPTNLGNVLLERVEILTTDIVTLASIPDELHLNEQKTYPPEDRHLQIRYDPRLFETLRFRSRVMHHMRAFLARAEFLEIETPILFKSTPEGAREFLVPTRKPGHTYALPQSPQQYKQILMASGVRRYMQFARCFRDEDLRADRQPEFTQLDLEMAFADGKAVMGLIEQLIKDLYTFLISPLAQESNDFFKFQPLPEGCFPQMTYDEAMSKYGSDKPDLRIKSTIHTITDIVPTPLSSMLTSVEEPIIEAWKFRLNCSPKEARSFVASFMDSSDAQPFQTNPFGAPGFCIYDSSAPIDGLSTFSHQGAENIKSFYSSNSVSSQGKLEDSFEDGDILVLQARPNLPHSGGSTMLGKLRLALHRAAVIQEYVSQDPGHHFLWITGFPMFTLSTSTPLEPGQGGASGFSSTHHPFTAPLSTSDADLLLTSPLQAKADHYDLVVNGVELGGGSRRIHNADFQKFVMRDILKMTEDGMAEFEHLFRALDSGCPPHAGFALGFDRLIAVMTGTDSIRDVIAFPKSSKGEDLMIKSPSKITDHELADYGLQLQDDSSKSHVL